MGPTPKDVFSQYTFLTGVAPLPQLFSIAYHQCRWNYKNEDDVKQVDAGMFTLTQHNNTAQHNAAQYNTTQYNTTQHNTTQHNTTQYNTTQHNTTQHNNTTQHQHNTLFL